MTHKPLNPETTVTLRPLVWQREDEHYIVGCVESGQFVTLPEIGRQIIERLQRHCSLGAIQDYLQQVHGVTVDLDSFITDLVELDFVQALAGQPLPSQRAAPSNLAWLQSNQAAWLFRWPVKLIYGGLLLLAIRAGFNQPELRPHYHDFFWSPTTSLVISGNAVMAFFILASHELAHLIAARSRDVPARLGLSTRLHYLVVQADVSALWAVPRQHRYRVYLAGIASDLGLAAVALLLRAYLPLPGLIDSLLKVLILTVFLMLLWQFQFFMRTDLYFIVMDLLKCHNLFSDALAYLRYQGQRLWSTQQLGDPLAYLPQSVQQTVRIYAWFVFGGTLCSLSVAVSYSLPILIELFSQASLSIWQGLLLGQPGLLLDGFLTWLIQGGTQLGFLLVFWRKCKYQGGVVLSRVLSQTLLLGRKRLSPDKG